MVVMTLFVLSQMAFELVKECPEAEFHPIQLGAHSASDPEILKALMKATEKAKNF